MENVNFNRQYTQAISNIFSASVEVDSVLEAGVGEATVLTNVANKLNSTICLSKDSIYSYPRIKAIPCLAPFIAILTTKMDDE